MVEILTSQHSAEPFPLAPAAPASMVLRDMRARALYSPEYFGRMVGGTSGEWVERVWAVLPLTRGDTEYALHTLRISREEWMRVMVRRGRKGGVRFGADWAKARCHFLENKILCQVFPELATMFSTPLPPSSAPAPDGSAATEPLSA